jgi:putative membrane protein
MSTALEALLILLPAVWYAVGVRALWARAGWGRGVSVARAASFNAAILILAVALLSPLDGAAADLFSAHMVQHLLLVMVVAPLWVLGAPLLPALWAFPQQRRVAVGVWWRRSSGARAVVHVLTQPGIAFVLHMVLLWFWHFPQPYQAALRSEGLHALEHLSFLGSAMLVWWAALQPVGRRRTSRGAGILLLGGTLLQSGVLGAVLMFAQSPWYPAHAQGTVASGRTLIEDQQLAGLFMWIPASVAYIGAAAWLFLQWMRADERRSRSARTFAACAIIALATSLSGCRDASRASTMRVVENGDAKRGKDAIAVYGCGSCHSIPGIRGADGMVGPPLDHWSQRRIIAGEVPNDPQRLITWITVPQSIEPGTAMPNMGVTDGQARDIAAYLYTLR